MQWLEVLGMVALAGLLFTAESKNGGVSNFINTLGTFDTKVVQGIGP
jgi:hypothetical protein